MKSSREDVFYIGPEEPPPRRPDPNEILYIGPDGRPPTRSRVSPWRLLILGSAVGLPSWMIAEGKGLRDVAGCWPFALVVGGLVGLLWSVGRLREGNSRSQTAATTVLVGSLSLLSLVPLILYYMLVSEN